MFDASQPARDGWVLKGGDALEMRFHQARATKDLVDLVLLIERQSMSPTRINVAVAATFARRGTHAVPTDLPLPPNVWEKPFMALAAECGIVHTLTSAYERVAAYWRSQVDTA
jgi:hypothetical protein